MNTKTKNKLNAKLRRPLQFYFPKLIKNKIIPTTFIAAVSFFSFHAQADSCKKYFSDKIRPIYITPSHELSSEARAGLLEIIKQAAGTYADINGKTILHHAAQYSSVASASTYLNAGAKLDVRDRKGRTPLMYAIKNKRDPEMFNFLYNHGASLHHVDNKGHTVLTLAIQSGNYDLVRRLVNLGCSLAATPRTQNLNHNFDENIWFPTTVLQLALKSKSKSVLEYLLSKGDKSVSAKNRFLDGSTPLLSAIRDNPKNAYEYAHILLAHHANVNQRDSENNLPLTYILKNFEAYEDAPEIVQLLLKAGAKPELRDGDGKSANQYAVELNLSLRQQ